MKATARKLLALIMAMAMCLSLLQGVAFAAESSEETPEAEPEVVEIVEDEKEEKKDVEEQEEKAVEVTYVTALKAEEKGFKMTTEVWENGAIKVAATEGALIAWSKAADYAKFVTVTATEKAGSGLVGTIRKNKEYTVTALASVTKTGASPAKASVVVADNADNLVKLTDADIDAKFVELTSSQSYVAVGGGVINEWKGFIYQEQQDNGSWIAYFKLFPKANDGADDFFNTAADHEWYYAKKAAATKLSGAGIATALSTADIVEATGKTAADDAAAFTKFYKGYTDPNPTLATVTVVTNTAVGTITTYDYADPDDNTDVTTNPQPELIAVTKGGSFKVRVTNTTGGTATYETSAEKVKEAMNGVGGGAATPWQVVSVSDTAVNDYWTVTIERIEPTVPDGSDFIDISNTSLYPYMFTENGATYYIRKVALADTANDGSYYKNAADQAAVPDRKSGISAGEILWGPVMVTKVPTDGSIPAGFVGAVFATVDDMKAAAAALNTDCSATKTVEYKQLALNLKVNGKDNLTAADIANLTGRVNYTLNAGAIFARTGANEPVTRSAAATVDKGTQHIRVKEVERTEPTCQKKGVKVTKVVCKKCGEIFSSTSVDLPIVTRAADKASKDNNYIWTGAPTAHYISRFETTKVEPTKDSKGSITYTYYCNLGEHHAELDRTEELGKLVLEHSGKWNIVNWGDQNPQSVRSPAALFGFTPIVYDSDIDNEAVLIDSDANASGGFADEFFRFTNAAKKLDGSENYENSAWNTFNVVSYDAAGKKVVKAKRYAARLVVSDIKQAEKECQNGSAKMTFEVYEWNGVDPMRDSQDNWLLTNPVATYTKEIVIPAEKTHNYLTKAAKDADGKTYTINYCTICGQEDETSKKVLDDEVVPGSKDISGAIIEGSEAYRGEYFNVAYTVNLDGTVLQEGIDYVVTNPRKNNFKGVGSHKITVAGIGDYSGTASGYVWITATTQKVTVSPTKTTLKVKALKKKAISFKIDVKGAKGAVSFSSNNKKVTVSKAGKVTVKKGTKKGTYKVTVKVAKNGGFKAVTKTVTITVK